MSRKAIDGKTVTLLIFMLTISTVTLAIPPTASVTTSSVYAPGVTQYPWPKFHNDLNNTGYTDMVPVPTTNETAWITYVGAVCMGGPAVADGLVFVGGYQSAWALNMMTGVVVWNYTTGDTVRSAPAVSGGLVYIGSRDGKLYAINEFTGTLNWSYQTGPLGPPGFLTVERNSPVVHDGKVFIGSAGLASNPKNVTCLDAATGALIWNYTVPDQVRGCPAVVEGRVYIGCADDRLYCLNETTGDLIWRTDKSSGGDIRGSPAVADGKVFFGSQSGNVTCLDMYTGTLNWRYTTGSYVFSSPAIHDGKVFVSSGGTDRNVYCLNMTTGDKLWNYTTGHGDTTNPYCSASIAGGLVFIGSQDRTIYALDENTGALVWSYKTGGEVRGPPAIADGKVFFGSFDGNLYVFGPLPSLFVDPASIIDQYTINQNFTLSVKVNDITDLYSWYIGMQWNPDVLECNAVNYVDTFMPDQATYPNKYDTPGVINNTAGKINPPYRRALTSPNMVGINGSGTLVNVTFRVKNCGETWINLTDVELYNSIPDTLIVALQNCSFSLSLPQACFTQTPPTDPYYVNETVITFDASCSKSGWNGTHDVPIANYTWDFGDENVTTVDAPTATVTHMYSSAGTFTVNLTVTCEDDPTLIAENRTADSTLKNLTVTAPVPVASLVVRTLWTNTSALVGANATVSNATYTMSITTNSSGLASFSLTKGLYNLSVSYASVTINETTNLNVAQDMTVTIKIAPAPYERIATLLVTLSNLQINITDLQNQVTNLTGQVTDLEADNTDLQNEVNSLQNKVRNNLYIGIGGGSGIGLVIGFAVLFILRKKS